jgi:hypothetical protein
VIDRTGQIWNITGTTRILLIVASSCGIGWYHHRYVVLSSDAPNLQGNVVEDPNSPWKDNDLTTGWFRIK